MIKDTIAQELADAPAFQDKRENKPLPSVRFPIRIKITLPYLVLAIGLAIGA